MYLLAAEAIMAYLLDVMLFEYIIVKANPLENQSEFSFVVWSTTVIFLRLGKADSGEFFVNMVEARSSCRLTTRSSPRGWESMANVVNEARIENQSSHFNFSRTYCYLGITDKSYSTESWSWKRVSENRAIMKNQSSCSTNVYASGIQRI